MQQVVVLFTRITLRLWYFPKREGMNKKANCVMSFDFSLHSREFVIKIRKINNAISLINGAIFWEIALFYTNFNNKLKWRYF